MTSQTRPTPKTCLALIWQNPRIALLAIVVLTALYLGLIYGTEILSSDIFLYSTALGQYSFAILTVLTVILLALCVIIFSAIIELTWHRMCLSDHTERNPRHDLFKGFFKYVFLSTALLVIHALVFSNMGWLSSQMLGAFYPSVPDAHLENHGVIAHHGGHWLTEYFPDHIAQIVYITLALPLVGIALGHSVRFKQAAKWQLRNIPRIALIVFALQVPFAILMLAHGAYYDDGTNIPETKFEFLLIDSLLNGISTLIMIAIVSSFYRHYLKQAFENTKATSQVASVFE